MAYILGLVVVGFFFLAMHYFTELDKHQKVIISSIILAVVFGAIAFNTYNSSKTDKMLEVVTKFNQNKTVKCNGLDVNRSTYTLSVGTFTFIGKKETPRYGEMISASTCE